MFPLVFVLKNDSSFRYLCFSGLFLLLNVFKILHNFIFRCYIYSFISTDIFWQVSIRSMIRLTSS